MAILSLIKSLVVLASLAAANPLDRRACIADNCLRALTVTNARMGATRTAIARVDCSSFMQPTTTITVTPTTITVYDTESTTTSVTVTAFATETTTSTSTQSTTTSAYLISNYNARRDVFAVPDYASACSGVVRYSSACSCISIGSSSTVTVTATATLANPTNTATISVTSTDAFTQTSTTTATVAVVSTSVTTIDEPYKQEWNQNTCGYATAHIVDYGMPGYTQAQAVASCENTCTLDPNCVLCEIYELSDGVNPTQPRCATFSATFNPSSLYCPDPGFNIGYSIGLTKNTPVSPKTFSDLSGYTPEWQQNTCGYSFAHIVDYAMPDGYTEDQSIDNCATTCTADSNCKLFEVYQLNGLPRCATFASTFSSGNLLCPDPGWNIGYSVGYQKNAAAGGI